MRNNYGQVFFFFVLVFILSIPFWILDVINPMQLLPGLPISALGAFTPAIAAFILVYKSGRLSGVSQLLQRSFDFKRITNNYWYLAIIFINPAIAVIAYWLILATGKVLPTPVPLTLAIVPLFILFFIAALGEEIGWSGFATEPLQRNLGVVAAGTLLGLVWAVWHFIPLLQVPRPIEWIAWWSLGTVSLRVMMVWIYTYSGKSIFAAAVFHAMINLCWQLFPNNGSYYDPRVFGLIAFGFALIVVAARQFLIKSKTQAA